MAPRWIACVGIVASVVGALLSANAAAQRVRPLDPDKAQVIEYWTAERRAAAIPRDLVIDPRGLGYLKRPDGTFVPYGHNIAAEAPSSQPVSPRRKPGGGGSGDTSPPTISNMDPASGAIIGASYTFKATVTDPSGVKSVSFKIRKGSGTVQSFTASTPDGTNWSVALTGFTDGTDWTWQVQATDKVSRGGNTGVSQVVSFAVDTSSGGGGGTGGGGGGTTDTVTSAHWMSGGAVRSAAGRLYFEMPSNKSHSVWAGYVCSGTVADDQGAERSIILTAAHCVYDDVNKAFARNVLFIPDQDGTTGSGTDLNCSNDPMGCWAPSFGVVDANWTTRTFPNNVAWDYAFYIVPNTGAHSGTSASSSALDVAAGFLPLSFAQPLFSTTDHSDFTYALGYSYSEDPNFMYCAEDMTTNGAVNWWLPSCGLTGGSSGGPWVQPMDSANGSGPIISVNSWGYTNSPGMAGPKFWASSADCIFSAAANEPFFSSKPADGKAGYPITCP